MIKDLATFCSKNALNMKRSEIREVLKMTRRPDIISFGGGLPDPKTFPVKDLEDISCQLLRYKGAIEDYILVPLGIFMPILSLNRPKILSKRLVDS